MAEVLRFAVIGSPIDHSLSPVMHQAAFKALGLPHVYERVDTPLDDLPRRIADLKDGTYAGLNVTVPLKERVLDLCDEISSSVRAIGAANTLVRGSGGIVVAHNTDAPALRQELEQLGDNSGLGPPRSGGQMEQATFKDRSVLVIGSDVRVGTRMVTSDSCAGRHCRVPSSNTGHAPARARTSSIVRATSAASISRSALAFTLGSGCGPPSSTGR